MSNRKLPVTLGWAISLLGGILALAGPGVGGVALAQATDAEASPTGKPTAESVLRRAADYYKKVKSFAVEVEHAQTVGQFKMQNTFTIAIQRPNRFAIHTKGNGPGIEVVSDGKKMFVSLAPLRKYTEGDAPNRSTPWGMIPSCKAPSGS